jgi:hypothetical protein
MKKPRASTDGTWRVGRRTLRNAEGFDAGLDCAAALTEAGVVVGDEAATVGGEVVDQERVPEVDGGAEMV